ncbi:hypothetical protein ACQKML_01995 [Peribacillus frigoritolerans]
MTAITHIGLAVPDLDAAIKRYGRCWDLGYWQVPFRLMRVRRII